VLHTDEFADVAAAAAASITAAGGNDPSVNLGVQFEEAMNGAGREISTSKIFLPKTLPNASDCQPQNIPGCCTLKKLQNPTLPMGIASQQCRIATVSMASRMRGSILVDYRH
jgi:hypothetical protein